MKVSKKMLGIFFTIAFGVPVLLGIFMGIGYGRGQDVSLFPLVWMYLPASGAMAAMLAGHRQRAAAGSGHTDVQKAGIQKAEETVAENMTAVPKGLFCTFIGFTVVMAVLTVANVFLQSMNIYMAVNSMIYLSCAVCFLELLVLKKERKAFFGLLFKKNFKKCLMGIGIFAAIWLALSLGSTAVELLTAGLSLDGAFALNPYWWINVLVLPLNFVLSYTAFFGEEYGWRFFLQPALQERLGKKRGVILLGLLWGIWHLPINLFYYSPETALQSILVQLAGCVGMGIFFGWVYMRTQNVWSVTIIHFLNNNLGLAIFAASAAGVSWNWGSVAICILFYMIAYLPFLCTKEYREKQSRIS